MCATLEHGTVALTNNNSYVAVSKTKSKKYFLATVLFSTDANVPSGEQYRVNDTGDFFSTNGYNSEHALSINHGIKTLNKLEIKDALARVGR